MNFLNLFRKRHLPIPVFSSYEETEQKALELLDQQNWSQVFAICDSWLKIHPDDFMIMKILGTSYYRSGKDKEETNLFSRFIRKCNNIKFATSQEISILTVAQIKQFGYGMIDENYLTFQQHGVLVDAPNKPTGLFVFVRINSNEFNFRSFRGCYILLDYIATEHYPLLWFRAQLDDGSLGKAIVEHFVDISDIDRISYLIQFMKSKTAIISIYDELGKMHHISGLILEDPSQTTRYLAQIYACQKDYIDNFRHATVEDFKKAQRLCAKRYMITQEW